MQSAAKTVDSYMAEVPEAAAKPWRRSARTAARSSAPPTKTWPTACRRTQPMASRRSRGRARRATSRSTSMNAWSNGARRSWARRARQVVCSLQQSAEDGLRADSQPARRQPRDGCQRLSGFGLGLMISGISTSWPPRVSSRGRAPPVTLSAFTTHFFTSPRPGISYITSIRSLRGRCEAAGAGLVLDGGLGVALSASSVKVSSRRPSGSSAGTA